MGPVVRYQSPIKRGGIKMNRLVCFAGLPGVGKSTLSQAVSGISGAQIIDIDDFKRVHVDPELVRSQIDPPELRWKYYRDSAEHAFSLFGQGSTMAILDEVFHLHSLRMKMEEFCRNNGVSVLWVEIRCSYSVVEERLTRQSRQGHILSTNEALRMYLLFQDIFEAFPDHAENHLVISSDELEDILGMRDRILKEMGG
jgi:predicted kinase